MILTPWVIVGIVKSSSFVPPTHMLPGSYYKNYISGGELHRRGRWERRWTCWTCKTWSIQSCFQWLRGEGVSLWVSMSLCLCFKNDFFIHLHKTILQIIHHCDICPIFLAFNHITRNSCKFRKKSFVEGERRQGGKCQSVGHKNCQEACGECRIIVKEIIKIATYHRHLRPKKIKIWSR